MVATKELITIKYENDSPTVLGRDLHEALKVSTKYNDWFPRMCNYGFTEGVDFNPLKNEQVRLEGDRQVTRTVIDHQLTIPMAKEICMLQRSDKGKMFRQYFISIEEQWNTPEMVMSRALKMAENNMKALQSANKTLTNELNKTTKQLEATTSENEKLVTTNKALTNQTQEWDNNKILSSLIKSFARSEYSYCNEQDRIKFAWGRLYKELFNRYSINLKSRKTKDHRKGNRSMLKYLTDEEFPLAIKVAVSMCENNNIDTGRVINKVNKKKIDSMIN